MRVAPHALCRDDPAMQRGAGFILTLTLLFGAGIGVHYGEGSLGIVIGLVVGVVAVALFAWRDSRRRR